MCGAFAFAGGEGEVFEAAGEARDTGGQGLGGGGGGV